MKRLSNKLPCKYISKSRIFTRPSRQVDTRGKQLIYGREIYFAILSTLDQFRAFVLFTVALDCIVQTAIICEVRRRQTAASVDAGRREDITIFENLVGIKVRLTNNE